MAALFRVICNACGWRSTTRYASPARHHRCPECRSGDLRMEKLSG